MPNPKMIYHLRNTPHPLPLATLAALYDDASHLEADVRRLQRFGLVREHAEGLVWEGS